MTGKILYEDFDHGVRLTWSNNRPHIYIILPVGYDGDPEEIHHTIPEAEEYLQDEKERVLSLETAIQLATSAQLCR